jgi:hypothetical protein
MPTAEQTAKDEGSSAAGAAPIEPKHTPGPWWHDVERSMGGAPIIAAKRGDRPRVREVAKVLFDNGSDDPEVRANARLIAAAPDLLEALTELLAMLRKHAPGTTLNNHRFDALGIKCNNAVAKAGG